MRTDRRLHWQQLVLPRLAKAARADLLHVPGFDAPHWKPLPVVLTVHDLIGMLFPHNLPLVSRFYWSWWLPRSIRWADRIIADSEHTRKDIIRLLGITGDRVEVIYPGVDAAFRPVSHPLLLESIRKKYTLPEQFILYLGTMEPRKGLDTLLAAFSLLEPDTRRPLVIAGKKGWWTEGLFRQVQALGLEDWVHFTGYIQDQDLPGLLSQAEMLVYPSQYEGFGLPVLEAMACGTPVICSDVASLPEVAGGAAKLVRPGDAAGLSAAVAGLIQDPALRLDLRARGLEQARKFCWAETARQVVRVYQSLL
jgi:glycosyltransferase involved in cell wall biosynthesis